MSDNLNNATAKYLISIQTEGSAAPAAQDIKKLGEEVAKVSSGITESKKAVEGHTSALTGNRMAYMELGHVARSSADALAVGINPVRVLAMETPRVVQAMTMLGVSMSNLLLPLALVGGAVAVWKIFGSDVEDSTEKTKELMDSLDKIPSLLRKIQEVEKAGRLSDAAAAQYGDYLNGKKKLHVRGDGTVTTETTEMISVPEYESFEPGVRVKTGSHDVQRNLAEASAAQAQEYVNEQLAGRGGLNDVQTAAIAKLKELEQQANDAALEGIAKQIAAVHEQFQKKRDEITATMKVAGVELTAKESAAGNAAIGKLNMGEANAIQGLRDKEDLELQRTYNAMLAEEAALEKEIEAEEARAAREAIQRQHEKARALAEVGTLQKELGSLENRIALENLTGEARKKAAIEQTTKAQIEQYTKLAQALGKSQVEIDAMIAKINSGAKVQEGKIDSFSERITGHLMSITDMEVQAADQFAGGLSNALVSFASGTKTAEEAFGQFATSFLTHTAEMILQTMILKAISSTFMAGGGTATANATGGVHYAANGIQTVSSATYLPKFNVVAGEQGMEMLTVLAKPTFRNLGGIDAVVGNAGNRRLAITNASDLENSGGGMGGSAHIHVTMDQGLKAEIVSDSIKGAQVQVAHDLKRNSRISQAVKGLTA